MPMILNLVGTALFAKLLVMLVKAQLGCLLTKNGRSSEKQGLEIPFESTLASPIARIRTEEPVRMLMDDSDVVSAALLVNDLSPLHIHGCPHSC
ncbi:hypothetical protein POTOM_023680 [Populus tomentosa]|uniref:Secreted protein n=1 Tax=Populus tomentosa TaxID=118781 RepID=A0A8X7ZQQ1_POPTO|nr:hypothetical protein POTOM_023680 [Populus tomentosa]